MAEVEGDRSPQYYNHYNSIATQYDELYDFWNIPLAKTVLPLLDLHPHTSLVDIGGGTGAIANIINKLIDFNLKKPICVVDPSAGLIDEAKNKPNITTQVATADEFFKICEKQKYDRILMCQCAHHFPDCNETFQAMYDFLPSGGKCVISLACKTSRLPFWKSLRENFGVSTSREMHILKSIGFKVQLLEVEIPIIPLTKRNWYDKIRRRLFSSLATMTDKEIEDGIKEVDSTLLCTVQDDEEIEMVHDMGVIVAFKP